MGGCAPVEPYVMPLFSSPNLFNTFQQDYRTVNMEWRVKKKKPRITSSRAKKPSPRLLGCQNHPDGASSPARAVRVRWGRRNRKRKRRRRRRGEQSAELQRDSPKQNTFFRERGSDSLTCPNREKARRETLGEK